MRATYSMLLSGMTLNNTYDAIRITVRALVKLVNVAKNPAAAAVATGVGATSSCIGAFELPWVCGAIQSGCAMSLSSSASRLLPCPSPGPGPGL